MKAEKALELVQKFSSISLEITETGKEIGKHLCACPGISGNLLGPGRDERKNNKGHLLDLHLTRWYEEPDEDEYPTEITDGEINGSADDFCPHCYAAHVAIQRRRALKVQLGIVKATMTKMGRSKQLALNLKK